MLSKTLKVKFFGVDLKKLHPTFQLFVKQSKCSPEMIHRHKEVIAEGQELDPEKVIARCVISDIEIFDMGNGFAYVVFSFVMGGEKKFGQNTKKRILKLFRSLASRTGFVGHYFKPTEEFPYALISYRHAMNGGKRRRMKKRALRKNHPTA